MKCQRENSDLDLLVDVIFNTDTVDSWLSGLILTEIKKKQPLKKFREEVLCRKLL